MALNKDILDAMDGIEDASAELGRVASAMRNISGIILEFPPDVSKTEMCSIVMDSFANTIDANRERMMRSHDELKSVREALS